MSEQPKALRWAKELESFRMWPHDDLDLVAAKELRRLHEVNQKLVEALEYLLTCKHGEFCEHYREAELKSKSALAKAQVDA